MAKTRCLQGALSKHNSYVSGFHELGIKVLSPRAFGKGLSKVGQSLSVPSCRSEVLS